jgi:putative flippase GtrA
MVCAAASFAVGTTVNFFLTRHYTIGEPEKQDRGITVQYLAYVCTGFVSLAIVQAMLWGFHLVMGFDPFHVKLASVPVVFVWTVLSSRFLVFTKKRAASPSLRTSSASPAPLDVAKDSHKKSADDRDQA